jgi:hypothetical protein
MGRKRAVYHSSSNRVAVLGLLSAPIAALGAGIVLNSSGPSLASAGNPQEQDPIAALAPIPSRELPESLVQRTVDLEGRPVINPLYYPERRTTPPSRSEPVPVTTEAEGTLQLPVPGQITAMMRREDGAVRVIIDGAVHTLGSELAPGWIVVDIDVEQRTVTLLQPDGGLRTLGLQDD